MILPEELLEKIEYYEVRPFVVEAFDHYDEVIIHFKPEPVLWGLWHRRRRKSFRFDTLLVPSRGVYKHRNEYIQLVSQLESYFS